MFNKIYVSDEMRLGVEPPDRGDTSIGRYWEQRKLKTFVDHEL